MKIRWLWAMAAAVLFLAPMAPNLGAQERTRVTTERRMSGDTTYIITRSCIDEGVPLFGCAEWLEEVRVIPPTQAPILQVDTVHLTDTIRVPTPAPATPAGAPRVTAFSRRTCNLGTQWAIDRNREPRPQETRFVTSEPYDVRINRHATPTSTDVVWEDCTLPAGTAVWCSASGCWVEVCGNDVLGVPLERLRGPEGPRGPAGPRGEPGLPGEPGRSFQSFELEEDDGWWPFSTVETLLGGAALLGAACILDNELDWGGPCDQSPDEVIVRNDDDVDVVIFRSRAGMSLGLSISP